MRGIFPFMVLASLAVHLLLVGGYALSYVSWPPAREKPPVDETSLTLLLPPPAPKASLPAITPPKEFHPVAMNQPPRVPPIPPPASTPPLPPAEQGLPVLPKPAPEANPNAHLPECPAEAVLNPTPPPVLDATHGVVFLLDISGSMYEAYAGSTRLTYARQAMAAHLRSLPDGTPFAVVLYAQRASPSGPLVAASDSTREAAVRFLTRDVDCGGGTNLPAGFAAAAALRTGAIVLASDGDLNISPGVLMDQAHAILGAKGKSPALEIVAVAPRHGTKAAWMLQSLVEQQGGHFAVTGAPEETALLKTGAAR